MPASHLPSAAHTSATICMHAACMAGSTCGPPGWLQTMTSCQHALTQLQKGRRHMWCLNICMYVCIMLHMRMRIGGIALLATEACHGASIQSISPSTSPLNMYACVQADMPHSRPLPPRPSSPSPSPPPPLLGRSLRPCHLRPARPQPDCARRTALLCTPALRPTALPRTVAVARLMMPAARFWCSLGSASFSPLFQAAGAAVSERSL